SLLFSLPQGTEMFQFPWSASSTPMDSGWGPCPQRQGGSPIRTSPDRRLLTAPRGISVFAPSFFGSWRPGIHRVLFVAYPPMNGAAIHRFVSWPVSCFVRNSERASSDDWFVRPTHGRMYSIRQTA